ncbi:MAG: hypothetical protein ACOYMA_16720 [Bacteroidia bacterium]
MKRFMILIVTCLIMSNVNASIDSLNCIIDSNHCSLIIDTNLIQEESVILTQKKLVKEIEKTETRKEKNITKLTKPIGFFDDAWDWLTDLFKPVHGYYEEEGQRNEGPYFLFDKTFDGPTYTQIQMQRTYKI